MRCQFKFRVIEKAKVITSVGPDFGYMLISLDVCSVICFDVVCKCVCVCVCVCGLGGMMMGWYVVSKGDFQDDVRGGRAQG